MDLENSSLFYCPRDGLPTRRRGSFFLYLSYVYKRPIQYSKGIAIVRNCLLFLLAITSKTRPTIKRLEPPRRRKTLHTSHRHFLLKRKLAHGATAKRHSRARMLARGSIACDGILLAFRSEILGQVPMVFFRSLTTRGMKLRCILLPWSLF